jgi:hypothetical protein
VQIVTGWILSQRRRYVTEVIFSGGNVDNGRWSRFHRFFSHTAWDLDVLSLFIAKLVVRILAPGATLLWAVLPAPPRRLAEHHPRGYAQHS